MARGREDGQDVMIGAARGSVSGEAADPSPRPSSRHGKGEVASAGAQHAAPLQTLLAGIVLLLALGLRLYRLEYQSFWGDEAFALRLAREPFDRLLPALAGSEPHPPLYYGLLHIWRDVAGESDFALRLLSTLFSVAGVAAIYGLGRNLGGWRAGLGAALLMAANPFQVWYAQETRMYAVLVGLTAWSALLFYTALQRGTHRRWIAYTAVTMLAIYSHYHALFVVLFENAIAAIWWVRGRRTVPRVAESAGERPERDGPVGQGCLGRTGTTAPTGALPDAGPRQCNTAWWLGSQAALLGLFVPWVYFAQSIFRSWSGWMPPADLPAILTRSFTAHTLGTSFPPERVGEASLALGVWAMVGLAGLLLGRRMAGIFLALYALVPLGGAYLLGELLGRSMFHERYLIVASPAFYLLLGYGLGWHGWRVLLSLCGIVATIALSVLALQNHYFDWHYQKDDLRSLARYIDDRAREGDLVVASITRQWLYQRYAKRTLPLYLIPPEAGPAEVSASLAQTVTPYRRLWYLPYARSEVDLAVDRWLAQNAYPAEVRWFNTARVVLAGVAAPSRAQEQAVEFGDRVRLEGYSLSAGAFVPGDVIGLAANWRAKQGADGEIKASLRLLDSRDHVFAQADPLLGQGLRPVVTWSPDEVVRDNYGLLLPVDTPPGDYRLELRLYAANDGRELPPRSSRGAVLDTRLMLGPVSVRLSPEPAAPAALEVARPTNVVFGDVAALLGYAMPAGKWQAGERVTLTLNWRGLHPNGRDYRPALRLVAVDGSEVAKHAAASMALPISRWRPGELVRDIHDWRVPPGLREGTYTLALGLETPDGAAAPLGSGATWLPLGQVAVAPRPSYAPAAEPQYETFYTLGRFARLSGYDISTTALRPDETLHLTLHWKALAESEESFKVFTHLLSSDERVWGQQDSVPCGGRCPTSGWAKGEAIADHYALAPQPDVPPGVYRIEVGMYQPSDGRRLVVVDAAGRPAGDRIILGEVTVW